MSKFPGFTDGTSSEEIADVTSQQENQVLDFHTLDQASNAVNELRSGVMAFVHQNGIGGKSVLADYQQLNRLLITINSTSLIRTLHPAVAGSLAKNIAKIQAAIGSNENESDAA